MTITVTVRNGNNPANAERKAQVYTVDDTGDGNVLSALVGELGGGEEVTTYLTDTRHIEVREV